MKIFQYRRGSTRNVLICFNSFVIKFPRIMGLASGYRWQSIKRRVRDEGLFSGIKRSSFRELFNCLKKDLYSGIFANVTEGWLSSSENCSFLHPVKCFIFFNFQRYAGEHKPTYEQLSLFFDSVTKEEGKFLYCIDPHEIDPGNWRIIDGKLRLIDYGGKVYEMLSFPGFLLKYRKEIEKGLSEPVT